MSLEMEDNVEGNKNVVVDSVSRENEAESQFEKPTLGMAFNDKNELTKFYSNYAREEGFAMKIRSSNMGKDGQLKYITFACSRSGKNHSVSKNCLHPQQSTRTDCKAKVNASVCPDGKFRLTSIVLEHNHELSPGKARYHKSNKKMNSQEAKIGIE